MRPVAECCSSGIQITVTSGFSEDSFHKPCAWLACWRQRGKEVVTNKVEKGTKVEAMAETEDPLLFILCLCVFYKAPGLPVLSF